MVYSGRKFVLNGHGEREAKKHRMSSSATKEKLSDRSSLKSSSRSKQGRKRAAVADADDDDWIAALAKSATVSDTTSTTLQCPPPPVLSKEQRIEKRMAKKRRREERKEKNRNSSSLAVAVNNSNIPNAASTIYQSGSNSRLKALMIEIQNAVQHLDTRMAPQHYKRLYLDPNSVRKGKATATSSSQRRQPNTLFQPRKRDYGGLGFARPSLFISLRDVSFVPKLEEEFAQHIPGFFGKQRTKSMKKQVDGNMLWRRLLHSKKTSFTENNINNNVIVDTTKMNNNKLKNGSKIKRNVMNFKIEWKKLADMHPDERFEAMIKTGMI